MVNAVAPAQSLNTPTPVSTLLYCPGKGYKKTRKGYSYAYAYVIPEVLLRVS